MIDKSLELELRTHNKWKAERDKVLEKIMTRSNRELKRLSDDKLLSEPAQYLANICVELDAGYGVGTTLTLNWMLDHYFEMEFERRVRAWLTEIYDALKAGGATEKNPVDLFKGLAFCVPHKEKMIFVHDWDGLSGYLVIVEKPILGYSAFSKEHLGDVYVRRIWKKLGRQYGFLHKLTLAYYRKKDFSPRYCDCRDKGHVFTTKFLVGVDHAIWDINVPMSWFMAINGVWTALVNVEASHGLSDLKSVKKYYERKITTNSTAGN